MSIYAAPGSTVEATVRAQNATTGLVGTIGVRITDGQGNTVTNRTTSGIIEHPAGTGIYTKTNLTVPDAAGQYLVIWDTGGGSPVYSKPEDLVVSWTAGVAIAPSGFDLTTLESVRAYLQKQTADTGQDPVIQQLITRASAAIETYAGREFHPTTGATRSFNYLGGGHLSLSPFEARSITEMTIDGSTVLAVTDDFWLSPASSTGGTYTGISFPSTSTIYSDSSRDRREITITGDWGFASVPPDVEQACILTVGIWLRRDVAAFSTTFQLDEQRLERPEALPSAARGLIERYRSVVVVG